MIAMLDALSISRLMEPLFAEMIHSRIPMHVSRTVR